jgi:putative pyruvate formate lyase activating enzyme
MQKRDEKIRRIEGALRELAANYTDCQICPRMCHANRARGERGLCGVGNLPIVSHFCLHFGEEPCLSGYYDYKGKVRTGSSLSGSGTVFFAGCNLKCSFCQNYQISWKIHGSPVSPERLASIFLFLQERKALNVNLVTPTHVILPILEALHRAFAQGLKIPIVYNTSAYDSIETIQKLAGIVDIYLPDFKYIRNDTAQRFSKASDYAERATEAIGEMYRQVGNLETDDQGNAVKGLVLRHLILPGCSEESCEILEWVAANLSTQVCISLMSQFQPPSNMPDQINRSISQGEYDAALAKAEELGFEHAYVQPYPFTPEDHLAPDFVQEDPFRWDEKQ